MNKYSWVTDKANINEISFVWCRLSKCCVSAKKRQCINSKKK